MKQQLLGWSTIMTGALGFGVAVNRQSFQAYPEALSYVFPGAIFLCLIGAGAAALKQERKPLKSGNLADNSANIGRDNAGFWRSAGLVSCYIAAVPFLGFVLATFLFQTLLLAFVFAKRGPIWLCAVPALGTTAFTLFFSKALSVPLPRGTGVFYSLNSLVI